MRMPLRSPFLLRPDRPVRSREKSLGYSPKTVLERKRNRFCFSTYKPPVEITTYHTSNAKHFTPGECAATPHGGALGGSREIVVAICSQINPLRGLIVSRTLSRTLSFTT